MTGFACIELEASMNVAKMRDNSDVQVRSRFEEQSLLKYCLAVLQEPIAAICTSGEAAYRGA
jgi:hypothetical protein